MGIVIGTPVLDMRGTNIRGLQPNLKVLRGGNYVLFYTLKLTFLPHVSFNSNPYRNYSSLPHFNKNQKPKLKKEITGMFLFHYFSGKIELVPNFLTKYLRFCVVEV